MNKKPQKESGTDSFFRFVKFELILSIVAVFLLFFVAAAGSLGFL